MSPDNLLAVNDTPGSELPRCVLLNRLVGARYTSDQALMDADMAKMETILKTAQE